MNHEDDFTEIIRRAMKQKPGGVMNVDIIHQSHCAARDNEPCDCRPEYRERRTQ